MIPDINLNNLCLEFRQVWVASAFRGAHSPSKTLPDMQRHLVNHKSWMEKLANKEMAVSGVIITGWSRFTHHTVLCELLPMSIPSLVLCLTVVERRRLDMKALYGSLVKNLLMRARILFLSMEDAFRECDNNLQKFV
jgi:hypothetical protein